MANCYIHLTHICQVAFGVKVVLVTHVLTHTEYDKDKWKK
jgi:mRNA-degrading endonuclease HigB of HigAB toxin-antitoxin module